MEYAWPRPRYQGCSERGATDMIKNSYYSPEVQGPYELADIGGHFSHARDYRGRAC